MPVEVVADAVVTHGGAGVGVAGGDLDVAQRSRRCGAHVRVHAWHAGSGGGGQVFEPAGGGMPVHSGADGVA
jgi:hypothetical protein